MRQRQVRSTPPQLLPVGQTQEAVGVPQATWPGAMQPTSFLAGKMTHSEVGGAHTQLGSLQLVTVQDSAMAERVIANPRTIARATTADITTTFELLLATM